MESSQELKKKSHLLKVRMSSDVGASSGKKVSCKEIPLLFQKQKQKQKILQKKTEGVLV